MNLIFYRERNLIMRISERFKIEGRPTILVYFIQPNFLEFYIENLNFSFHWSLRITKSMYSILYFGFYA